MNIKPFKKENDHTIVFYETDEQEGDLLIKCTYDTLTNIYTEHCWNKNNPATVKTESWKRRGFEPIWGIDQIDWNYSYIVASRLANIFDKEKLNEI